MKLKLLFSLLFIIPIVPISAQALLFEEDFESYAEQTGLLGLNAANIGDYPDNTPFTIDTDDLDFTVSANDYAMITGEQLAFRDLDGEAIITFDPIDISSQTGDLTLNIGTILFDTTVATSGWETTDYVDVYYSLDGGNDFVFVPDHMGNGDEYTTFSFAEPTPVGVDFSFTFSEIIDPQTATSLILQIRAFNDSGNEDILIDDITVSRGGVTIHTQDFSGFADPSGVIGIGSDNFGISGDYPAGVTKWTLTPASNEQFGDSNDYVFTQLEGSSNVLEYNDINGVVTFDTQNIDITGQTDITFSFDINFRTTTYEDSDYVDVFYSIDGGAFVLLQDDGNGHTYSGDTIDGFVNGGSGEDQQFSHALSSITGANFILRIEANNNSPNEDYQIDNIQVISESVLHANENSLAGLVIYPNPVKEGLLNIKSPQKGRVTVLLYDISGREVYKTELAESHRIDLSKIQSGLYTLKIIQNNKSIIKKLIR